MPFSTTMIMVPSENSFQDLLLRSSMMVHMRIFKPSRKLLKGMNQIATDNNTMSTIYTHN